MGHTIATRHISFCFSWFSGSLADELATYFMFSSQEPEA